MRQGTGWTFEDRQSTEVSTLRCPVCLRVRVIVSRHPERIQRTTCSDHCHLVWGSRLFRLRPYGHVDLGLEYWDDATIRTYDAHRLATGRH